NVGCVPKKVMWHAADFAEKAADAAGYGFGFDGLKHDWPTLCENREAFIRRLNGIYERNLDKDGVEYIVGRGSFDDAHTVAVGDRKLTTRHAVIATGGQSHWPDVPGVELGADSDGFFAWTERPNTVAIVGSGYIAVELAGVLNSLGTQVTLLLRNAYVLKQFDTMLGDALIEYM